MLNTPTSTLLEDAPAETPSTTERTHDSDRNQQDAPEPTRNGRRRARRRVVIGAMIVVALAAAIGSAVAIWNNGPQDIKSEEVNEPSPAGPNMDLPIDATCGRSPLVASCLRPDPATASTADSGPNADLTSDPTCARSPLVASCLQPDLATASTADSGPNADLASDSTCGRSPLVAGCPPDQISQYAAETARRNTD